MNDFRTLTAGELDIVAGGNTSGSGTVGGLSGAGGKVYAGPGPGLGMGPPAPQAGAWE